ncbi:hypothetical protein [Streptomyces sp. NPDC001070]
MEPKNVLAVIAPHVGGRDVGAALAAHFDGRARVTVVESTDEDPWLRPASGGRDHHAVLRRTDPERLTRWPASPETARWRREAADFAVEPHEGRRTTDMETWFHLPGADASAPPRWKTALVTGCAVYPFPLLLNRLVTPRLSGRCRCGRWSSPASSPPC